MSGREHVMTVSGNGQVSIPARARARWQTNKVIVVDLGDRVVVRPLPAQPVDELIGKYRDALPDSDTQRARARRDESRGRGR